LEWGRNHSSFPKRFVRKRDAGGRLSVKRRGGDAFRERLSSKKILLRKNLTGGKSARKKGGPVCHPMRGCVVLSARDPGNNYRRKEDLYLRIWREGTEVQKGENGNRPMPPAKGCGLGKKEDCYRCPWEQGEREGAGGERPFKSFSG